MNYKQQSNQGCLVVDLMYLFGIEPTREKEEYLLSSGLFYLRENYTLGCLLAFLDCYPDKAAILYVDNAFYFNIVKGWIADPRITIIHKKNDMKLLNTLDPPFIVYVDNNITDGWTHLPHFILVTSATEKFYDVFDPWDGKTHRLSKSKLLGGIESLRNHIKVCPFVIVAKTNR